MRSFSKPANLKNRPASAGPASSVRAPLARRELASGLEEPAPVAASPASGGFDFAAVSILPPSAPADLLRRSSGQPLAPGLRMQLESRFDAWSEVAGAPVSPLQAAPAPPHGGARDDRLEQEADHVADLIISGPSFAARPGAPAGPAHDFGRVRIHDNPEADTSTRALGALAYTFGPNIVFRSGHFAPDRPGGRHLLAHELAHVIQQSGRSSNPGVQRKEEPPPPAQTMRRIKIPAGINSPLQLYRYAETIIFGRVVNLHWAPKGNASTILLDVAKHVGTFVSFEVSYELLARYGTESSGASSAFEKAASDQEYASLLESESDTVNAEIDRRYYESTETAPGTKIQSGETGAIAIWNSFKQQVMADRRTLAALPQAIKDFLHAEETFRPENYPILVRLSGRLSGMSAAELEDYRSKVNAETSDLSELEAALDLYLQARKEREAAGAERDKIETRLSGTGYLYEQYKSYRRNEALKYGTTMPVVSNGHVGYIHVPASQEVLDQIEAERLSLLAELRRNKFNSIEEFEGFVNAYETAFLDETVAIGLDLLARYEHILFESERMYQSDPGVDALLGQIAGTAAPSLLAQASSRESEARELQQQASFSTVQGAAHLGNKLGNQAGMEWKEAAALRGQADQAVGGLAGTHPLLRDPGFPRLALVNADRASARETLFAYIADRRSDLAKTRANLAQDAKIVYKLDRLFSASYSQQGIQPGSIYDQILRDRQSQYLGDEALWKIALAVVGLALTLVTFGGGALGAAAAVGAFGLSGYQAIEELREYELRSSGANLGLLSESPSLGWVVVSVVGAAADLGSALSAVKVIKASKALEALEESGDVAQFEKDLSALTAVQEKIRKNVVRAARAEQEYKRAIAALHASGTTLNVVVLPGFEQGARLTVIAYYAVQRGILSFNRWLLELEAAKVIQSATSLAPEELNALKAAWEQGKQHAATLEKNIPHLEQAMKEFRAEKGIAREVTAEGVKGGTTAAARAQIEGLSTELFKEGSTRSKGTSAATVLNNPRYQSPQRFPRTKNHAEQNILGNIADEIDNAKGFGATLRGKPKPEVTGNIYLHVEARVCNPCRQGLDSDKLAGVIKQFSDEYPNLMLVITNLETDEIIFVKGGILVKGFE